MLKLVNLSGVGLIPFTNVGLAALDARLRLGFRVDEDEMLVRFRFQACVENGAADMLDFGLSLATDGAAPALIGGGALYRQALDATVATTHTGVTFEWYAKLPRGSHIVALFADQVLAASENVDTGPAPCLFSAENVTNEAVLGHGVESKVFNAQ